MSDHRVTDLAYWINEREHMRLKRETTDLPPPWSVDPLMATNRYCNVRREDDRVTRWIAKNVREPLADSPYLTLGVAAARFVNWPDTLAEAGIAELVLGRPWAYLDNLRQVIASRSARGAKAWSSAYIVSTNGLRLDKEDYICQRVLPNLVKDWNFKGVALVTAHSQLMRVNGIGSFMAGQIVADLKNVVGDASLCTAPDWWTWACMGPGSLRGLAAFLGHPTVPQARFLPLAQAAYAEVKPALYEYVGELHMQDFQNCLCEFSKYIRVKEGDGRARNKYVAHNRG